MIKGVCMWNDVLNRMDKVLVPMISAQRWGNASEIELVSEGINLVYRFILNNQKYYLRLTHAKLRSTLELQAAISYQQHLFEHDVSICQPMLSQKGLWFESVWQGEDEFLAHVCKEVPGQPINFNYSSGLYKSWGIVLGKLHQAASLFRNNTYQYAKWSKSFEEMQAYANHESKEVQQTLKNVSNFFHTRMMNSENYGITHGDHREGNVITDGKQIHIIDFDLPSENWFTEDLFRPFFDSVIYNRPDWQDKMMPYLEGYFSIRPQETVLLSSFSWQMLMKSLEIYLWTKNNWNHDIAPGGGITQQWLSAIKNKIINNDWLDQLPQEFR